MTLHFLDNLVFDVESTRKHIIIASLKSELTCKLINIIAGSCFFLYQVYQARLRKLILNRSAKAWDATTILEA